MSGYSETSLVKKLGIKEGYSIKVIDVPQEYSTLVKYIPKSVIFVKNNDKVDFIYLFTKSVKDFEHKLLRYKDEIVPYGMIWVSWPKKSSGVETDLDENKIRDFALELGLVDVKVCAVDEVWSGLKLVYRVKNR
jgi:hypothetical protein